VIRVARPKERRFTNRRLKNVRFETAVERAVWKAPLLVSVARDIAVRFESWIKEPHMRNLLFSIIGSVIVLAAFNSCSTSVKSDSGHGVTAGVHDTGHGVTAGVHTQ
jgi:hypothetical protein